MLAMCFTRIGKDLVVVLRDDLLATICLIVACLAFFFFGVALATRGRLEVDEFANARGAENATNAKAVLRRIDCLDLMSGMEILGGDYHASTRGRSIGCGEGSENV